MPMDFFLVGAMKDPVYNSKPHSLDDLKMAITMQFNAIKQGVMSAPINSCLNVVVKSPTPFGLG